MISTMIGEVVDELASRLVGVRVSRESELLTNCHGCLRLRKSKDNLSMVADFWI